MFAQSSFTLDANGNRTGESRNAPLLPASAPGSISYTYSSAGNRLVNAAGASFTYDNNGQLHTGYGTSYTFDYEHRLTKAGAAAFAYDGAGNRLQMVYGTSVSRYVYDAKGNVLAIANGNSQITGYFIYGAGLLEAITPAGAAYGK